jgi:nitrite reductase (cytochrome c-552)
VETIQERTFSLRNTAMDALMDLIQDLKKQQDAGASDEDLAEARNYQRKAQFLLDFVEKFHGISRAARVGSYFGGIH